MLTRFRANPEKVRVSICRDGSRWRATVACRDTRGPVFEAHATGPRKALVKALLEANDHGIDGIDLGMGWAYEHPQHPHDA